jgi:hypothetical protein
MIKTVANKFNHGDVITLKSDLATIKQLKKWDGYCPEIMSLIGEEHKILGKDNGNTYKDECYDITNDYCYPEWALTLVKKAPKTELEITITSKDGDEYTFSFVDDKAYAILECGEEFYLKDIVELGEMAKKYLSTVKSKKPLSKKAPAKKRAKR